ncbi:MAG: adenosylcobinamide-phosphate synthase CbiB [Coriobacteriales bacterium]|nr:adenosylcobinamide-phosphate synthase CbiB [Coriobacteriales bacterium]
MARVAALLCAFALDALLGDPYNMPHVVRLVGTLIGAVEKFLRDYVSPTRRSQLAAGVALVLAVVLASVAAATCVLWLCWRIAPWLGFVAQTLLCYQLIAARQLRVEARRVYDALVAGDLPGARQAVSMIVGRDTHNLDAAGVTRAAVETVAENTSDGVVAPLLWMALAGPVGGVLYKAVNTMDSMVGYRNERYEYLGRCAAHVDDVCNWVPARLTGALMCLVAPLVGLDGRRAWHILARDRHNHASPNAAYPEAACAGALGVQLAGPTSYFGVMHDKPTIGDATRPVCPDDIVRANRLCAATSLAAFVLACGLALVAQGVTGGW